MVSRVSLPSRSPHGTRSSTPRVLVRTLIVSAANRVGSGRVAACPPVTGATPGAPLPGPACDLPSGREHTRGDEPGPTLPRQPLPPRRRGPARVRRAVGGPVHGG